VFVVLLVLLASVSGLGSPFCVLLLVTDGGGEEGECNQAVNDDGSVVVVVET
jgi:hypothetical protein